MVLWCEWKNRVIDQVRAFQECLDDAMVTGGN